MAVTEQQFLGMIDRVSEAISGLRERKGEQYVSRVRVLMHVANLTVAAEIPPTMLALMFADCAVSWGLSSDKKEDTDLMNQMIRDATMIARQLR